MQRWAGFFQPYLKEIRGTWVSFFELTFQTLPSRHYLTAGGALVREKDKKKKNQSASYVLWVGPVSSDISVLVYVGNPN